MSHAQKLGISYHDEEDNTLEQDSRSHENPDESYVDQSIVQIQSSSVILISHPAASLPDEPLETRPTTRYIENIVVAGDSEPMRTDATGGLSEGNTEILAEDTLSISEQIEVTAAEENASQDIHIEDSTS